MNLFNSTSANSGYVASPSATPKFRLTAKLHISSKYYMKFRTPVFKKVGKQNEVEKIKLL